MLAAVAAVVIVAFVVTTWLLAIAGHAAPGTDQANARLDAVRTGLAAGAGAGAAVGLMLAFRRQHHQEIATVLTDLDATERRITELYTKAVEQLGNDKAPVRLGGLYALERLAQDNPAHRQTIVNVICAYLRMPFSAPPPVSEPEPEATVEPGESDTERETSTDGIGDTWQQERQVRLTAQRILAEHLRDDRAKAQRPTEPPSPRFWPDIRLDLAGATLIEFYLTKAVIAEANFREATFGRASFDSATFGRASFDSATFSGGVSFGGATFGDLAWFYRATFGGVAMFNGVTFSRDAWFEGVAFSSDARFSRAAFSSDAWFEGVAFSGVAGFSAATVNGDARFDGATINGDAQFDGAAFSGFAKFYGATFSSDARFYGATFTGDAGFKETTFSSDASFDRASFSGNASFDGATFSGVGHGLSFTESRVLSPDAEHVWPTGWCLGPDGEGGYTVVRANDEGRT
jgi:uncharacterized protein YjbI with pentapeptide repeats